MKSKGDTPCLSASVAEKFSSGFELYCCSTHPSFSWLNKTDSLALATSHELFATALNRYRGIFSTTIRRILWILLYVLETALLDTLLGLLFTILHALVEYASNNIVLFKNKVQ